MNSLRRDLATRGVDGGGWYIALEQKSGEFAGMEHGQRVLPAMLSVAYLQRAQIERIGLGEPAFRLIHLKLSAATSA